MIHFQFSEFVTHVSTTKCQLCPKTKNKEYLLLRIPELPSHIMKQQMCSLHWQWYFLKHPLSGVVSRKTMTQDGELSRTQGQQGEGEAAWIQLMLRKNLCAHVDSSVQSEGCAHPRSYLGNRFYIRVSLCISAF